MTTTPIQVPIELLDKVSGQLATLSQKMEAEATRGGEGIARGVAIGTMAWDAAKMAYQKLSGFITAGVADAMEAEKANLALGDSQAALVPYLEQLADKLNTSDDAMKRSSASILKTGMVTDDWIKQVMKGLPAFEALGIGVEQGGDMIAQALLGATRGLKQFGIEMEEGSSRADVIDAITKKMAEMEGRAVSLADSGGGKIRGMAEAWGEVRESMGTKFIDSLTTGETGIKNLQIAFDNLGTSAGKTVGLIVKGLEGVSNAGSTAGSWWGNLAYGPSAKDNQQDVIEKARNARLHQQRDAAQNDPNSKLSQAMRNNATDETLSAIDALYEKAVGPPVWKEISRMMADNGNEEKARKEQQFMTDKARASELGDQRKELEKQLGDMREKAAEAEKQRLALVNAEYDRIADKQKQYFDKLRGELGDPSGDGGKRKARYEESAARDTQKAAEMQLRAGREEDPEKRAKYESEAERLRQRAQKAADFADPRQAELNRQEQEKKDKLEMQRKWDTIPAAGKGGAGGEKVGQDIDTATSIVSAIAGRIDDLVTKIEGIDATLATLTGQK